MTDIDDLPSTPGFPMPPDPDRYRHRAMRHAVRAESILQQIEGPATPTTPAASIHARAATADAHINLAHLFFAIHAFDSGLTDGGGDA